MIKNKEELLFEVDMLRGNINRMCITDDEKELEDMYKYAKIRLDGIYSYSKNRVQEEQV